MTHGLREKQSEARNKNSKSEARNPKQILNSKVSMTKTHSARDIIQASNLFWSFEF